MNRLCGPCVIYASVVGVLSLVALSATSACIALSLRGQDVPPLLAGLATVPLSALAGFLAPSPWVVFQGDRREPPST